MNPTTTFRMGDDSGGPITDLSATDLAGAIAEARDDARDTAAGTAADTGATALQDWVVFSVDDDGDLVREADGLEQADPSAPSCADGQRHAWRNPDPEWAGRGNDLGGGITAVRVCPTCGTRRTVATLQDDGQGGTYDSVAYAD